MTTPPPALCAHNQYKGQCRYTGCPDGVAPPSTAAPIQVAPAAVNGEAISDAAIMHAIASVFDEAGEAEQLGLWAAARRVDPSLTAFNSVLNAVRIARSDDTGPAPDLVFRSLAEIAREVDEAPPPSWLFEPVIVAGDYGVLSAEDKGGKTWAGIDAAVSCAAGLPWMGQYPCGQSGTVIMFYGEGSARKAVRRIRAVAASKGLTREQADALDIIPVFRAPKLSSATHRELIREVLTTHRPALVIIDPLYLAAGGANSADLISMGELLQGIQHIVQDAGASLLISHHFRKTGQGDGHDRSSGVGPGAWGRFLVSVAVKSRSTDAATKETTVRLRWQFRGDEIADLDTTLVRRVRADDPSDLSSTMHYAVTVAADPETADQDISLAPSERKLLEALRDGKDRHQSVAQLVDRIKDRHGHGLRRETCSRGLRHLAELDLAVQQAAMSVGYPSHWLITAKGAAQLA
ncbi:AAA family ATPase [Streptomyces sp. NPDC046939]|uniref:AAA family ATPase n=1 Tax=Streptomyces sp. NPDC046939 TaxID=3155376 RepID=UPI00340F4969